MRALGVEEEVHDDLLDDGDDGPTFLDDTFACLEDALGGARPDAALDEWRSHVSEVPTIPAPRASGIRLHVTRIPCSAAKVDLVTCDLTHDPRSEDFGVVVPLRSPRAPARWTVTATGTHGAARTRVR